MEFRDLKRQYQNNKNNIDAAIAEVLHESCYIGGEQVKKLENFLADYVDVKYCISCANGTDALQLALMAWKIGKGDAVFVPDFTFFSSAEVVSLVGATPVFVDVDTKTFNISAESLEETIEDILLKGVLRPKVIVAVDLFGQPAEYPRIREIAQKYNLLVLEDGAQGFGGRIEEQKACSFGDISTTSFFPAKPLGCYGDGGAIFTDNLEWAELIRSYKVHGKGHNKYDNVRIGLNSRLDTIQAAVLLSKFEKFENEELNAVNQVAEWYNKKLSEMVEVPVVLENYFSSWAQYTIKLKDQTQRDYVKNYLNSKEIPSMIYYPKPLHMQEAFTDQFCGEAKLVNSIDICHRVLSLPMHPYLKEEEVDYIAKVIQNALKE